MHPVLIKLPIFGGFPIYTYGFVLMIAFVLSTWLALHLAKKREYSQDAVSDFAMSSIIAGIIGCRLGFVLQYPAHYLAHPLTILNLREGGMTIMGGIVMAVFWTKWLMRHRRASVLNAYDFFAAPLLLGMAVGRIGCLMHGCCFGEVCDLPWAVTYPEGTLPAGLVPGPRHPSQIYEMLMDLILLGVLLWQLPRLKFAGQNCYTFFFGYGIIRFVDESTRYIDEWWGPLGTYQWYSLVFIAIGLLGLLGVFGKPPVDTELFPTEKEKDAGIGAP